MDALHGCCRCAYADRERATTAEDPCVWCILGFRMTRASLSAQEVMEFDLAVLLFVLVVRSPRACLVVTHPSVGTLCRPPSSYSYSYGGSGDSEAQQQSASSCVHDRANLAAPRSLPWCYTQRRRGLTDQLACSLATRRWQVMPLGLMLMRSKSTFMKWFAFLCVLSGLLYVGVFEHYRMHHPRVTSGGVCDRPAGGPSSPVQVSQQSQ